MLESSYITTFDSFALSVVKKYHYLLNLSPNINIIDNGIITIKKNQVMDEIFLEYYEEKNPLFLKMIDAFCSKDDTDIRNYFLTISNKLDLLSNKEEYLNHYLSSYFSEDKIQSDIQDYTELIRDLVHSIFHMVHDISYEDSEFSIQLEESLSLLREFSDYDDLVTRLNIKLPNAPRGSSDELKSKKKEISDAVKEIRELAHYRDSNEIREGILKTYPIIQMMIEIILKFTFRIREYKRENASYEFNDIAIMAIDIVKNYKVARDELSGMFQEIMIDEYQDTNDLQEEFISLISHHNTYMVGDIKQSIYRFRNANPYIFKSKYDDYSVSSLDTKIDLNKNFRSRSEVLDNINLIFNLVMNDSIGGADYISSHQMIFGNQNYLKEEVNHSNDMEIWNYTYDKELGYSKEEVEAFMIASDIRDKMNSNYQIFDKDSGMLRNAQYGDFSIIMDRATYFDLYKKIFNYFSIPITLLKDEKMNDESDVLVLSNLIRLIIKIKDREIDKEFEYLFVSVSRSFLCQISDDEIFDYVKNKNYRDSFLYQECLDISKEIDYITVTSLIDRIVNRFDYYNKFISIGNIEGLIVKISKVRDMASSLESLGYTIRDFSNYLVELLHKGYVIEYKVNDDVKDSVKIMTIHKSKGLEYPVCYFSGLYKEFNISDLKERFLFDKKLGFIVPYFDEGICFTIYKQLLRKNYIEEEISEKIRLFYVALTRAREKMILVCPSCDDVDDNSNVTVLDDNVKIHYRSFLDILNSIYFRLRDKYIYKNLDEYHLTKDYNVVKDIIVDDKIDQISTKISVQELDLKEQYVQKKSFSKKQLKLISKEEKKAMEFGTKVHEYLEYLDLKNPCFDDIDDAFCRKKIEAFVHSDFLSGVQDATVYQEYEFIYEDDGNRYHGIIDLMLEYDDHIDIVDYKLKNISDDAYQSQLKGYYNYISTLTKKKIYLYLYSIIDEKISKMI